MRILLIGMIGDDVRLLQKELNKQDNAKLAEDGFFGNRTMISVKAFQVKLGLEPDGIVGFKTYTMLKMTKIKPPVWLVLHCSATPERTAGFTAMSIANYHIKTKGWGRCGYARIIEDDGKIVETHRVDTTDGIQPFEMTYGTGNSTVDFQALNVCYTGGLTKGFKVTDTRTEAQKDSMDLLVRQIVIIHPHIKVAGHNQFFNKGCPSFWVEDWLKEIDIPDKNIYKADPFGYGTLFKKSKTL
jgi:N-acetylmuramoyl-L-alanine amidase